MKQLMKRLHLWLSIPVRLIFCMFCITGAILVFEKEITDAVRADSDLITEPGTEVLSIDSLTAILSRQVPEGVIIRKVLPSADAARAYTAVLSQPRGAKWYVNQYTGVVMGDAGRLQFFATTERMHRWLLDSPKQGKSLGRTITGWCAVVSFFIVLTGLIIWWPTSRKMLKTRLKIKSKPARAFWYTLHVAGGFYTFLIFVVIILTGVMWSFPAFARFMHDLFGNIPIYNIHVGNWLGLASKIIWFVAALIGATLPITGYYFWLRKKPVKK